MFWFYVSADAVDVWIRNIRTQCMILIDVKGSGQTVKVEERLIERQQWAVSLLGSCGHSYMADITSSVIVAAAADGFTHG